MIDKLAALVPHPRIHRHRYYGVLAPNPPFRGSVTAMVGQSLANGMIEIEITNKKDGEIEKNTENKTKRPPNRYLWVMLLARIYNLFPLLRLDYGAEMQVISVIQDKPVINKILKSVGEERPESVLTFIHFVGMLELPPFYISLWGRHRHLFVCSTDIDYAAVISTNE